MMEDHTFAVWFAGPLAALKAREARRAVRLNMAKSTTALAQHLRQSTGCRRAVKWRGWCCWSSGKAKGKSTLSPEMEAPVHVTFALACMLHLSAVDWSIWLPKSMPRAGPAAMFLCCHAANFGQPMHSCILQYSGLHKRIFVGATFKHQIRITGACEDSRRRVLRCLQAMARLVCMHDPSDRDGRSTYSRPLPRRT